MALPKRPGTEAEADGGERLLLGLKKRDRGALEELALRFGDALSRAAYLYLGDPGLAADAAQEALIAAWEGARRAEGPGGLRPWLFGILFNRCRKMVRAEQRRRARERVAAEARRTGSSRRDREDEHDDDDRQSLEKLRMALARLEQPFREVIILRYERGFRIAEVAAALGIPEGTVKSRTHTALRRLKEELEHRA